MVDLFKLGKFISSAGKELNWKVECDALTDNDWNALAAMVAPALPPFYGVRSVPTGGNRFARALVPYLDINGTSVLIVDDVYTTGRSMGIYKDFMEAENIVGVVAFARSKTPDWIIPIWSLNENAIS